MMMKHSTISGFLFVLLLVFDLRRADQTPIVPMAGIAQLLVVCAFLFFIVKSRMFSARQVRYPLLFLLALMITLELALISGINSEHSALIFQRSTMIMIPSAILILSVITDPDVIATFESVIFKLVLSTVIICSLAIIVYLLGNTIGTATNTIQSLSIGPITISQSVMGIPPLYRTGGLFGNPNVMSRVILVLIPFLLALRATGKMGKIQFWTALIIFAAASVLTISRLGMSMALISIFIYLVLLEKRVLRKFLYVAAGLFSALIAIFLYTAITYGTKRGSVELNGRDDIWGAILTSISNKPIFGVGFGVSHEAILIHSGSEQAAHSFYLEHISELGVIGAILTATTLLVAFSVILVRHMGLPAMSNRRPWSSAVLAFFITFLMYMAFETGLYRFSWTHFMIVFIIATALHGNFWVRAHSEEREANR